jgi:hypothetical protein
VTPAPSSTRCSARSTSARLATLHNCPACCCWPTAQVAAQRRRPAHLVQGLRHRCWEIETCYLELRSKRPRSIRPAHRLPGATPRDGRRHRQQPGPS